jgi:hypothetical protein
MLKNKFIEIPEGAIKGGIIAHTGAKTRTGIEGFSAIFIPTLELYEYNHRFRNLHKVWLDLNKNFAPKQRQLVGYVSL